MADNFIQEGDIVDHVCTQNVLSGGLYAMENLAGVAMNDGAIGDIVPFAVEKVWIVPLTAGGSDLVVGDRVHLVAATSAVKGGTSAVSGDINKVGVVFAAGSVAADSHIEIKLTPDVSAVV